jgi:hypothetical protein
LTAACRTSGSHNPTRFAENKPAMPYPRSESLDTRFSFLDIQHTPNRRSLKPAALRVEVEPVHRPLRSQQHAQLQLCVPLVATDGDSYRMKQARQRGGAHQKPS